MSDFIDEQKHIDLFQKGYDSFGQNPLAFSGGEVNQKTSSMYEVGTPSNFIQSGDTIARLNVVDGYLQSDGFVSGSTGWQINSDGDAEFNSGTFRGSLSAGTIDIGGADATSFHVDADGNQWLGAATFASAPFKVSNAGAITATGVAVTGAITTGAGSSINGTYVDSLNVNKLAAGTITSKTVTLAIAAGTGDVYFNAGKTDFTNTETGFILGMDDSDSDLAKFYIGSSTAYMNWTGSAFTVAGATITGGIIQTAEAGTGINRIRMNYSTNAIEFVNNTTTLCSLTTDGTNSMILTAEDGKIKFDLGTTSQTWFMDNTGFYPNSDKTGNLGSSSKEWNSVYSQDYKTGSYTGKDDSFTFDVGESHNFVFVSGLLISRTKN